MTPTSVPSVPPGKEDAIPCPRWRLPAGSALSLLIAISLVLLPPVLLAPRSDASRFDATHRQQLLQLQPDYVFIGSSALISRIDPGVLAERRHGEKGYILGEVGSLSSLWYLWLKNSLIASGVTPKAVFVFFRDLELTSPADETNTLINQEKIARHLLPDDDRFFAVLNHHKTWVDRLREWLRRVYPIQESWRVQGQWLLESLGMLFALPGYPEYQWNRLVHPERATPEAMTAAYQGRKAFKARLADEIFSAANQRVARPKESYRTSTIDHYDFAARKERSFLPEMIRLAAGAHLKLVFVRVEHQPNQDGSPQHPPKVLVNYLAGLAAYLREQGVGYHDFDQDPAFSWELYLDAGHIKPQHMRFYTEHFLEKLGEFFR
ncbi:MAG: hypothetical protein HQL95_00155 [Magnetococcales bacterium]|nr:hypothetical protein [Magnetococcales bacterium]